ncbi:hypothetical protein NECAME_02641 [Necator americanus]|uniref:Uncharacterized protein n=1 Tax=Necator americanus TaxID=51031 RepID=W2TET6_NECAM|nr:hypothetical protein NECAME_02641 [Necator americanus]ETN79522.1 hypothetical protein NECAME_02641 [Necator americanus]
MRSHSILLSFFLCGFLAVAQAQYGYNYPYHYSYPYSYPSYYSYPYARSAYGYSQYPSYYSNDYYSNYNNYNRHPSLGLFRGLGGLGVDQYGNTYIGTPKNGIFITCNGRGCPGRGK